MIDSQCHVSDLWYEPVESLLEQMTRHGVQQAVLIQMLGQQDNDYQQACVARFPQRFASVVSVDPEAPEAIETLRRLRDTGASGVRLRPTARSLGSDPLAIWRAAADCGMAVSCVGNSAAFSSTEFADLVESVPRVNIVLEHLGGTSQPDADEAAQTQRLRVFALSRFANVFLKVPGLGELTARRMPPPPSGSPFSTKCPDVLLAALAAFGAQRLMWGSDFPPVSAREGYGNALAWCRDALDRLPATDLQQIFGGVAARVFKIPHA